MAKGAAKTVDNQVDDIPRCIEKARAIADLMQVYFEENDQPPEFRAHTMTLALADIIDQLDAIETMYNMEVSHG